MSDWEIFKIDIKKVFPNAYEFKMGKHWYIRTTKNLFESKIIGTGKQIPVAWINAYQNEIVKNELLSIGEHYYFI